MSVSSSLFVMSLEYGTIILATIEAPEAPKVHREPNMA